MLGELVATQNKNLICKEIRFMNSVGIANVELQYWINAAVRDGYPDFNINVCHGDVK